jgi:hypothetical protein
MDSVDRFHNKYVKKIMDSAISRKKFINQFYELFRDSACDIDALEKDFNVNLSFHGFHNEWNNFFPRKI